jgi:O-antigen biosynthesis protein
LIDGSNVNVGVAQGSTLLDSGLLVVGGTAGGSGAVTIGGASALLVDGSANVGGAAGSGSVAIGQSATDTGLLAMTGTLTIGPSGMVTLGGAGATVRAAAVTIDANGGMLAGAGVVSGDGGGSGTVTLTSITNDGTITADGALLLYGSVTGAGTLAVANNAKLTLQAAVGPGQTLSFAGPNGVAEFNDVGAFNNNDTITGFSGNDVLDLASTTATGATWDNDTLTITTTDAPITLTVEGNYAADAFFVHPDGAGGTDVDLVPCYLAGTLILTDQGERPVETLAIGDTIITADAAARPIRWIGRRSYGGRFAKGKHLQPICIKASALEDGVPQRDLWISPHHAMFLEGVLIEAQDLVNCASIVQADGIERIDYFHIELDTHDILIAEGAPSESFIDDDSRAIFQNAHEYKARYPNSPVAPAVYCAPRAAFGPELERARRHITARAGIPYAPPASAPRPRALVIDSFVPQVGHSGGANAILDHMRALQAAGFEVNFIATQDLRVSGAALSAMGVAQLHEQGATARSVLRRHAGQFDLVYLHRVDNAARYGRLVRQYFNAQIIYSVADLHHVRLQAQCKLERDPARAQELRDACAVIALREIAAAIGADDVITHSIAEAEQLRQIPRLAQAQKVHVIPWSIPVRPVSTPFAPRAGIAFVGGFKHAPNVDAARWFVDEVLPTVRQIAPEIECQLVGSDLTDELRRDLTRAGVTILGQIKNLDEIFESVRLTVAPLRFGAGLKDKVLRSLAAGLPCVGTTEAFRGMVDLPCAVTHMCIADTPSELAAAIVQMHRDEVANTRCAAAGLEYVRANYNKSRIDALTRALVRPALERHRNGSDAARSTSTVLSFADAVSKQIDGVNHFDAMRSRRLVFGRAQ